MMTERLSRRSFLRMAALAAAGAAAACAKTPPISPTGALPEPTRIAQEPTAAPPVPTATPAPSKPAPQPSATPEPATPAPAATSSQGAALAYFGLHPFIEAHPEAVFIKRTQVAAKTDAAAKKAAGMELAKEVLTLSDKPGIPLTHQIAIKPNLTCTSGFGSTEGGMGIITDRFFMEGLIEGMKGLGFPAENMAMREGNWMGEGYCSSEYQVTGYNEVAERTGVHVLDFPTGRKIYELTLNALQEGTEVVWKDCPGGVVFKRIGYVAPFNHPESWLLDVAKFKAHGMGMTLTVKNLQGMCISPYVRFCEGVENTLKHPAHIRQDFQPDLEEHVARLHKEHLEAGVPRWDRPGRDWNSGYGMEMWAQRTCDSHSVTRPGLCIIEGIYGRNGDAFMKGPGPKGEAEDFMTNVLIFGKNPFRVDIIGNWLAGHEPGNFGLFHIARERGLVDVLNPVEVPVYLWEGGTPKLTPLASFERVPLKTYYLQRNYGAQSEPLYHLVDEPFDYARLGAAKSAKAEGSRVRILGQMHPGSRDATTVIEYCLVRDAQARLEVCDARGQVIDVLADGPQAQGVHAASWNTAGRASGIYTLRLRAEGREEAREIAIGSTPA
jgi:uncharacterized protein (DUF362 family)